MRCESERSNSAVKVRASSLSSEAKYKVLEMCLRNHPMVLNIQESYNSILQLKNEVEVMLKMEAETEEKYDETESIRFKDYIRIVENIPLEDMATVSINKMVLLILNPSFCVFKIFTFLIAFDFLFVFRKMKMLPTIFLKWQ